MFKIVNIIFKNEYPVYTFALKEAIKKARYSKAATG